MESRKDLEAKIARLEKERGAMKGTSYRGVRKRASWGLGDLPLYDIAVGPDPERGEIRGHARGIVAVGDIATGFVAVGGWARGFFAVGGLATGLLSFGGGAIGILAAVGGLAIGGAAMGGAAIGGIAIGGGAVGQYACGGAAYGQHVLSATERDPVAVEFFDAHGLGAVCNTGTRERAE